MFYTVFQNIFWHTAWCLPFLKRERRAVYKGCSSARRDENEGLEKHYCVLKVL
jgi:hypothetical protein